MLRVKQGIVLSVVAIFAAVLKKDQIVSITANKTVNKSGAGSIAFGRVLVPAKAAGEEGTIEVFYREYHDIKTTTNIAANDFFKMAAPDGTTGENTIAKWVSGTDAEELKAGICFNGASANGTASVFFR
ncbi:MAG: hypothetical protein K1X72_04300 [Pyrinomonadaceae bacterium]|nr:hypothetical protein [Pyrinomonadaceae bacterium]